MAFEIHGNLQGSTFFAAVVLKVKMFTGNINFFAWKCFDIILPSCLSADVIGPSKTTIFYLFFCVEC